MSKKFTNFNERNNTPAATGQDIENLKLKKDMNEHSTLSGVRSIILSSAVNLVRLIDTYTNMKAEATGVPHNTISEFRNEAVIIARAAANEMMNPDDDTFSEEDAEKAELIIDALKIQDDPSKQHS